MNNWARFHKFVGDRIDPTFDFLERVSDRYPSLRVPINFGLIVCFPAWIVLAEVVKARKNM